MALTIVLKDFAGPLDLLWHLIKQEKLDIYDIPIAQITGQYLEYLQAMQDNALDVAGDYFVMAASLMALKSRMLLPEPEPEPGTEEMVEDPRAELVEQLLNYQVFQEAADQLRDLEVERSASFAKPASLPPAEVTAPLAPGAVKLIDFQRAVADVVHRVQQQETAVRHIEAEASASIEDTIAAMRGQLQRLGDCDFTNLIDGRTVAAVITSFLALLEMMKTDTVVCTQAGPTEPIHVYLKEVA